MKTASPNTQVATQGGASVPAVSQSHVPEHLRHLAEEHAGLGNSTAAIDNTLPFLGILQALSPQIKKQEPEYIPGAEEGMIFNTATGQLWKGEEGVDFVACGIQRNYVQWVPRSAGGGYVDTHPFDNDLAREMGAKRSEDGRSILLPSGNQLVETLYTFGLLLSGDDSFSQAVISATSTALRPMRDWMSVRNSQRIGAKVLPAFARTYRLRTVYQKNDQGSWYGWKIALGDWTSPELTEAALDFAKMIAAGEIKLGRPMDDFSGDRGSSGGAPSGVADESIPV